MFKYSTERLMH